jgi:uncharacterized protein YciI
MQYLVLATTSEKIKYEEMPSLVHEEVRRVWELYKSGVIRSINHRGDVRGVVFMLEADNKEDAEKAMESLPLVQAGLAVINSVIPLKPYLSYKRLFRE